MLLHTETKINLGCLSSVLSRGVVYGYAMDMPCNLKMHIYSYLLEVVVNQSGNIQLIAPASQIDKLIRLRSYLLYGEERASGDQTQAAHSSCFFFVLDSVVTVGVRTWQLLSRGVRVLEGSQCFFPHKANFPPQIDMANECRRESRRIL